MRVALISSEVAPFAKTGGLADAVAGLAWALADEGVDTIMALPGYRSVEGLEARPCGVDVRIDALASRPRAEVLSIRLAERLRLLLIDVPELFDRRGLYGEEGKPYADNLLRFSVFSRAAMQALRALDLRCDVLHAHDWQAALVPLLLKVEARPDPFFDSSRSVLTIHNLAYQGNFPADQYPHTGLDERFFTVRYSEYYGSVSLLKGGIVAADAVTTVSPTYAEEVLRPEYGAGLDGVLRDRGDRFRGILNGIDAHVWNPATDPHLVCRYRADAPQGKGKCKRALLEQVGLKSEPDAPLIGVISRLVAQKGIDLLTRAMPSLLDLGARWVVLGTGDAALEDELSTLAAAHPDRIAVRLDFDDTLAHRIQAGADYLLMPSRFEPCGLNQMYAMRYGTVPIVSGVGGLADTVTDVEEEPGAGTGVVLRRVTVDGLVEGVGRALDLYRKPRVWAALRRRAMERDHSWPRSAREYARVYRSALDAPPAPIPAGPGAAAAP